MRSTYHPFPPTHWSLVHRAAHSAPEARKKALASLLARYLPALKSYLRTARKLKPADADDLLQSFIADKVLARDLLKHADASRGRFRTFLLTSLNNYAASRHRKAVAKPTPTPLHLPAPDPTPARAAEAAWARTLLQNVLDAMRHECRRTRRPDVWAVFQTRILAPIYDNTPPPSYADLAKTLHLASPTQAANLLVTAKRLYARLLRTAIAEYERDDAAIDDELAALHNALSEARP
jgi:RNA polymerase sigma-70 factor (ECF subfamily)